MQRLWKIGLVGIAVTIGLPLAVVAQKADAKAEGKAETYKVDPVHSSNWFRIKHMNMANFYGRFNTTEGTYTFDDANPAGSAFDIQVNVDTIDTHNEGRDKHLKSPEFFDAAKYPTIAFKSKSVKKTGENTFEATGDLTLHGETRPLTVKIERTGAGPGMKGEHRSALETTFDIKRSEFGMKTMIGPLGDDVRLNVSIEGVRE